jgi:hypothetical protein
MLYTTQNLYALFINDITVFCLFTVAFIFKIYLCVSIVRQGRKVMFAHPAQIFLTIVLFSSIFHDLSWVMLKLLHLSLVETYSVRTFIRIAWVFNPLIYGFLALLLLSLKDQKRRLFSMPRFLLIVPYLAFSCCALYFLITYLGSPLGTTEPFIYKIAIMYLRLPVIIIVAQLIYLLKKSSLPKIIQSQISTFLLFFITPFLIFELVQAGSEEFKGVYAMPLQILISASALLLTLSIHFCLNRLLRLRFLNIQTHVYAADQFRFLDCLKTTLVDLGHLTNFEAIAHRTKTFFAEAFQVPAEKTTLHMRGLGRDKIEIAAESFFTKCAQESELKSFINETQVLIYDEIVCSDFYYESSALREVIAFMNEINADIFIPIKDTQKVIAYLMVERQARKNQLYTNVERDQMLMYASYLGNILYVLENKNFEALMLRERQLKTELFEQRQENNQYKESIRLFMRSAKERQIGVVFYRNDMLMYGNQAARELLGTESNSIGITQLQAVKKIAQNALLYKTPQYVLSSDQTGNKLALSAFSGTLAQEVIIIVHHPEISDMIREQVDRLPDPSEWDHLISLTTTGIGKLISQAIPGYGKLLLPIKISLLKASLNKSPVLLAMENEDALGIARLISQISASPQFHHVTAYEGQSLNHRMFGVPPTFSTPAQPGLLKELDDHTTLFIENIDHADIATQQAIANFIKTGSFRFLGREHQSDTRIVVSSTQDLPYLAAQNLFCKDLLLELQKNTIKLPSILTLPSEEFLELVDGYSQQISQGQEYRKFFTLSAREKEALLHHRPVSLQALKKKIQMLLLQKTKQPHIEDEAHDATQLIEDADLAHAARLGKQALRDQRIMTMLWNKLKNPASIASFLGVNRTSVYRRIKAYNLAD